MTTSTFDYYAPASVSEAASLLAKYGADAKILAGGHSLIPLMKLRLAQPTILIDLRKVSTLSDIKSTNEGLAIGAMTTYHQLETSKDVKSKFPVLSEAASLVADMQVRNMGTIGGSITYSDPAGDLPAVVLALDAQINTVTSTGKGRRISIDEWFQGLLTTAISPTEILTSIDFPSLPAQTGAAYEKFANKASHYAVVGVAAVITGDGNGNCVEARVGITGAGDYAVRAVNTEAALKGKKLDLSTIREAAARAADGIDCLSDIHASAEYRQHLTKVYARRAIERAVSQIN